MKKLNKETRMEKERLKIRREVLQREWEYVATQKDDLELRQRDVEIKIAANILEAQDIADKLLEQETQFLIENNL